MYEEIKKVKKNIKYGKAKHTNLRLKSLKKKLDNLFNIVHANAFDIIKIEIDKEFLCSRRMPDRPGCLLGVDMQLMKKEKRQTIRKNKETTK